MFFRTRSREPASATPKPLDMVKERAVPAKTLFILGQEDHDLPEGERDVLGVDDDSGCQVLAEMLQDSGYVVDTAVTLAEAKQLLAQFRYGVVLADWRPPDGDGSVLANLLRFRHEPLPGEDVTRQPRCTADADEAGHAFRFAGGGACLHRAARPQRAAHRPAIPASAPVAP